MEQNLLRDLFCLQCSLQFNGKYVYDLHKKLVHGSKDLEMKKGIKSEKSDPESNTPSPILPTDEEFKCNNCNAGFPSRVHLNKHAETVHREMKPFECNICNANFSQKGSLKGHIKSVHEEEKLFKCNICTASFLEKGSINRHIESVHKGKKPFKCNDCDKVFSLKGNLKKHIDSAHEGKKLFLNKEI